jgi:hypothetical protein
MIERTTETINRTTARRSRDVGSTGNQGAGREAMIDSGKGEELCLALLLRYPELRPQGLALRDDLFVAIPNRQLFQAWRETSEEEAMRASLPEELYEHLDRIVSKDLSPHSAQAEKSFTSCIRQIERRKLKEAKTASSNAIAETEKDLGAARLARSAHQLLYEGDLPEDLPEDEALPASIVVRGMETGREMHTGPREGRPKED